MNVPFTSSQLLTNLAGAMPQYPVSVKPTGFVNRCHPYRADSPLYSHDNCGEREADARPAIPTNLTHNSSQRENCLGMPDVI